MYAKLVIFSYICKQKLIFAGIWYYELRRFITDFCGNLELTFVALHRVLKNKCDLFFVFLSVCTTLAEVEYHSRTREACSAHREPLKMRRVPEKGVSGTEYPFRTTGARFLHRMPLKTRRVP